jgi:hypothetical protein
MNRDAYDTMSEAERVYLLANGWVKSGIYEDDWSSETHGRKGLTQGHAVNVQKQSDRAGLPSQRRCGCSTAGPCVAHDTSSDDPE